MCKTYDQTEQIIEHRDGLCNDPGNNPDTEADGNPGSNGEEASAMHLVGSTEDAHVNVFARNMTQDDTGKNSLCFISLEKVGYEGRISTHSRDRKTPGNLAHQGVQRKNSGRLDIRSDVVIDEQSADQVQDRIDDLKHCK